MSLAEFKEWMLIVPGGALLIAIISSFEIRLRGKVGRDEFNILKDQSNRNESHLWDIMKALNVKPTIEPPGEITNNHK